MMRGAPSIYMLYLGYDEVAHHSGPWTSDAYGDLKRLDKTFARLRRVVKDKAPRCSVQRASLAGTQVSLREHQEAWAEELSTFLVEVKQRVEREGVLQERAFKRVRARYHAILAKGRRRHPGCPGKQAQSKAANLLDRLEGYDLSVLAFLVHPEVPFTNNQGERDIRMEKVRQKISGCFRALHGARVFARIRSYISTCRKQGRNILDELEHCRPRKAVHPVFGHSRPMNT